MSKHKESKIRLGPMELQIMHVVWQLGRATVHDVKDVLGRGRKPAYTTVLTMMRKLEAKGYLEHDVDDRTYVYRSTITRQTVRHSMVADLLDRVFEGSPQQLLATLVEQDRISEAELKEVRRLIRKRGTENE